MHFTLDGADGMGSSAMESQSVHISNVDPVVSLQAQLMLSGLHYTHPHMVASTAGMDVFSNTMTTPPMVASPSLASVYESHQVPGSPASSVFSHPAVSTYSSFVSDVSSPGSAASPHTPRSTVRSLLAEKKIKTEQPSTPAPELQLEQILDIKPLLRKPIDTSKMSSDQINRLHRRRQRNKAAATRCRIKRREKAHSIRSDLTDYSSANDELEREILHLQEEKHKLEMMLAVHTRVQKCHITNELDNELDFQSTASPSDSSADSESNATLIMTSSPIDVKPQIF